MSSLDFDINQPYQKYYTKKPLNLSSPHRQNFLPARVRLAHPELGGTSYSNSPIMSRNISKPRMKRSKTANSQTSLGSKKVTQSVDSLSYFDKYQLNQVQNAYQPYNQINTSRYSTTDSKKMAQNIQKSIQDFEKIKKSTINRNLEKIRQPIATSSSFNHINTNKLNKTTSFNY